jgi:nucleotide-binding universal stress UspA family protein
VHAVGVPFALPFPDISDPDVVQSQVVLAERLVGDCLSGTAQKFPDVEVRSRVVVDSPVGALVAASSRAAVVVVGCRGRGTVASRCLGSVSRSVVEMADSTVVVVRDATTSP